MEVLFRIAEEKYIFKLKSTTNYAEAVKNLWKEHLINEICIHNSQEWRN